MSDALQRLRQIRDRAQKVIADGRRQVDEGTEVMRAADQMIAELTGGVTDAEARRRRRGMYSLSLIPAGIAGGVALAKDHPIGSAVTGITASAILGAILLMPPGQGDTPRDTAPGVIAGPAPTAPPITAPPGGRPTPEAAPPASLRPAPTIAAQQVTPPNERTIEIRRVHVPSPPADTVPPAALPEQLEPVAVAPLLACAARVQLLDLDIGLLCR